MDTQFSWMEPRTVEHPVNGNDLTFHEVSVGVFSKLRPIAEMATSAIMQLMRSARDDAGSQVVQQQRSAEDFSREETHLTITPDLARYHEEKRDAALGKLTNALMGEKHQKLIAEFIADSLQLEGLSAQTILTKAGSGIFVQCLTGALKANAEVFGPLAPVVRRVLDASATVGEGGNLKETLEKTFSPTPGDSSQTFSPSLVDEVSTSTP